MSACEDEDGRPFHQVIRFQTMPPVSAHRMTCEVTSITSVSISPEAMVLATAVPISAPTRFIAAASSTACQGSSALVATTVAMEFGGVVEAVDELENQGGQHHHQGQASA